ncbi:MAG: hypothetical protein JO147_03830 [Actinobacteria bacterium]|nr:hypothetical protein [Actinomycetota bacterium]
MSLTPEGRPESAKQPGRPVENPRPEGVDDGTVEALGKLSEALEVVEEARGLLYSFHRRSGTADRTLQEAVLKLRVAGHAEIADHIEQTLVGRDVVRDMWTFQIVESYDDQYWSVFRDADRYARESLVSGTRHIFEAEMKHREQR